MKQSCDYGQLVFTVNTQKDIQIDYLNNKLKMVNNVKLIYKNQFCFYTSAGKEILLENMNNIATHERNKISLGKIIKVYYEV